MRKNECIYCEPGQCRPTYLYVVADKDGSGPVKVGISFHPIKRLAQHRKKTRRDLCVHWKRRFSCEFAAADAEDTACEMLRDRCVYGDWFDVPVSEVIAVAKEAF